MEVRRINPEGGFVREFKDLRKRVQSQETRASGNIVIRETLQATDPETGVATIISPEGIQPFVYDITPPPVASTPIVASVPGVISVTWDGQFVGGELAPKDFTRLNIIGHKMDGETTVSSFVVGEIFNASNLIYISSDVIPVGETWTFSFEAEDYNTNRAAWSARSLPVTMESVVTDAGVNAALEAVNEATEAAQTAANDAQTAADTANTAAADAAQAAQDATTLASGKSKVHYNVTQPSLTGNTVGDMWVDIDDSYALYSWSGSAWVKTQDSQEAIDLAATKIRSFVQGTEPVGTVIGDIWMDTANQNELHRWDGDEWISYRDLAIADADGKAAQAIADAASAQDTADGKVTTYFETDQPTGLTAADSGDLWFDTNDGNKMWRWSGSAWLVADDQRIAATVTAASNATTIANSKITTFYQDDQPSSIGRTTGDLWVNTLDNNKLSRWNGSIWQSARDLTIASASNSAAAALEAAQAAQTAAEAAQAVADGSIRTWYQPEAPTGLNNTTDIGDLWFDTDNGQASRWTGSAWALIQDNAIAAALSAAQSAQTTADGKITSFYQPGQPATGEVGDLWFDTDDKNKPYYCSSISPLTWTQVRDGSISDAQATANTALTSANGKNKTYYQTSKPTGGTYILGDTWVDTDDQNKLYVHNGTDFVSAQDGAIGAASSLAASKGKTIIQSTAPSVADQLVQNLWIDTTNGANTPKRWNTGTNTWTAITDKIATDAATAAVNAQTKADTAFNNAATAATAAGNAQTTADGKNRVWYQTTAPAGTAHKDGDLWFDTDDGNKLYLWKGTPTNTWSVFQDAAIGIAQTAANNAATAASNAQTSANTAQTAAATADSKAVTAQSVADQAVLDAETAQQDADQALADALAANNLAASKGKVLYQTTAPTGVDANPQTLWIDTTSNLNTPKRWVSGTTWTTVTDKVATDAAALAATKGKILYQTTAPTGADANLLTLWIDTTNGANTPKKWVSGTTWQSLTDKVASDAASLAATKGKILFQTTAPTGADASALTLWIDTTNGANTPKKWVSGTTWVAITDKVALDAATAAANAATAASNAQGTADTAVSDAATAQTLAQQAFDNAASAATAAGNAQTSADSKNRVWYQATAPTGTAHKANDVWFDTDDGNKPYRWVAGTTNAWVVAQDAAIAAAQATADAAYSTSNGKNTTYYQPAQPSGGTYILGDLWFDTDAAYKLYTYTGSIWQATQDAAAAKAEAISAAATDATDKANAAQAAAIEDADAKVDLLWKSARAYLNDATSADGIVGTGPMPVVVDSDTAVAGKAFQTSGQAYWVDTNSKQAFDPTSLYRIRARVRMTTDSTGTFYLGFAGYAADGVTYSNSSGADAVSGQHWAVNSQSVAPSGVWTEFEGFVQGYVASGGSAPNNGGILNPMKLHTGTKYVAPIMIVDYAGTAGVWEISHFSVDVVDATGHQAIIDAQNAKTDAIATAAADATTKADIAQRVAIQGQAYLNNASFEDWTGTYPAGFAAFNTAPTKETSLIRTGKFAMRFNCTDATTQRGVTLHSNMSHMPNLQYFTLVVDVRLNSGTSFAGAGVLVDWLGMTGGNRVTVSLASEIPTPTAGKWYRLTKVIQRPATATGTWTAMNGWLMGQYSSGMGTMTVKDIVFDWIDVRPSTAEEITAFGTPASITALTTTVNSKTRTWYQSSAPSLVGNTNGDIWFDTANGNKPHVWNGAWSSAQDAAIATAQSAATTAQTAANGKNKVIYSPDPASGTTGYTTGDTWFQRDGSGTIIAQWEFTTSWQSRTLNESVIAAISAGKIVTGTLNADRIGANTINTTKMTVGDFTNLIDDPDFDTPIGKSWTYAGPAPTYTTTSGGPGRALLFAASGVERTVWNLATVPVKAGDQFLFGARVQNSTDADASFILQFRDESRAYMSQVSFLAPASSGWTDRSMSVTVPADVFYVQFAIILPDTATTSNMWVTKPFLRRKNEGSLIVDGAIQAGSAIIADAAIGNAQIADLHADKITAGTIAAARLDAEVVKSKLIEATYIVATDIFAPNSITSASGIFGTMDASVITAGTIAAARLDAEVVKTKLLEASLIDAVDIIAQNSITATNGLIASLDAGKITVGTLAAARIGAKTIGVDKLLVQGSDNLIVEGDFGGSGASWDLPAGIVINATAGRNSLPAMVITNNATLQNSYNVAGSPKVVIETVSDATNAYRVATWVKSSVTAPANGVSVIARFRSTTGTYTYQNVTYTTGTPPVAATFAANTWVEITGIVTAPANTISVAFCVSTSAAFSTGVVTVDQVMVTRAATGELIVDGAVTATKIATGSITATNGIIASIDAAKITVGSMSGTRIAAKSILADRLVISSTNNLIVEADFSNNGTSWGTLNANKAINATAGRGSLPALRITGSTALQTINNLVNRVTVGTEDRFRGSMYVKSSAAAAAGVVKLRMNAFTTATTSTPVTIATSQALTAGQYTLVEGYSPALPANTIAVEFFIEVQNAATGTTLDVDYVSVTRAADGKLVIDGAMDAKTITGALFQTDNSPLDSPDSRGIKLNGSGLKAYDPFGEKTFGIDALTGVVSSIGTFSTESTEVNYAGGTTTAKAEFGILNGGGFDNVPGLTFQWGSPESVDQIVSAMYSAGGTVSLTSRLNQTVVYDQSRTYLDIGQTEAFIGAEGPQADDLDWMDSVYIKARAYGYGDTSASMQVNLNATNAVEGSRQMVFSMSKPPGYTDGLISMYHDVSIGGVRVKRYDFSAEPDGGWSMVGYKDNAYTIGGSITHNALSNDITITSSGAITLTPLNAPTGGQVTVDDSGVQMYGTVTMLDDLAVDGEATINSIGGFDYTAGVAKMPYIVLSKVANQTLSAANTFYNLLWDGADVYNYQMTHSSTVNNHQITIQKSGIYEINYKIALNTNSGHVSGAISINGVQQNNWIQRVGNNSGQYEKAQLIQSGQFNVGDVITIMAATGTAGAAADSGNVCSIRMIVPT